MLNEIYQATEGVKTKVANVVSATEEQSAAAEQISSTVQQLIQNAEKTAEHAQDSTTNSELMLLQAGQLEVEVSQFKVA